MEYVIAILAALTVLVLIYGQVTRKRKSGGQGGRHESGDAEQK